MNATVTDIRKGSKLSSSSSTNAGEEIQSRYSQELVIALSGPVGSGVNMVQEVLSTTLRASGYEVVHVRISSYFQQFATELGLAIQDTFSGEYDRISKLQDLGNSLRKVLGDDLGAQIAMNAIALDRTQRHPEVELKEIKPTRVAYVVDQLKNPFEATLLRDVYGNMFYLVGVLASYERRKQNLVSLMAPQHAEMLIERDREEADGGGQQLEKTLKLADYFVRNSQDNAKELERHLQRFVDLVHGRNGITPTVQERGMYAAFSAALQSACLSRQVGAAILDSQGNILATGCNDVPKAGGGLYEENGSHDHRCVFREGGVCFNDKYKDKLRDEITELLKKGGVDPLKALGLAKEIRKSTRLKDLIEFSRAVHAEMDALISAARKGGRGVQDGVLFTTTYPCHNCARHIVAAGIRAVYFVEPYGKSLASELHSDSIDHDADCEGDPATGSNGKVAFLHFDGVAPRRFSDLFYAVDSRKDSLGKARQTERFQAAQRAPELLDNYRELEAKIAQRFMKKVADGQGPHPAA